MGLFIVKKANYYPIKCFCFLVFVFPCLSMIRNCKCNEVKTGYFEYVSFEGKVFVKRDKAFQYEKDVLGESKYKVSWRSDCTYDLTLIETTKVKDSSFIGRKYNVEIIEVSDKGYTYKCSIQGQSFVFTDKMIFSEFEW